MGAISPGELSPFHKAQASSQTWRGNGRDAVTFRIKRGKVHVSKPLVDAGERCSACPFSFACRKGGNRRCALPEHTMRPNSRLIKTIYSSSVLKGDASLDSCSRLTSEARRLPGERGAPPPLLRHLSPVVFSAPMRQERVTGGFQGQAWLLVSEPNFNDWPCCAPLKLHFITETKNKQCAARIKVLFEPPSSNRAEGTDSLLPAPAERRRLCFCGILMTAASAGTRRREGARRRQRKGKTSDVNASHEELMGSFK